MYSCTRAYKLYSSGNETVNSAKSLMWFTTCSSLRTKKNLSRSNKHGFWYQRNVLLWPNMDLVRFWTERIVFGDINK